MANITDGTMGVDLTAVSAGTTTDGEDAKFKLGQRVIGTDGTVWVYVQAGSVITQYDALSIDENFQALPLTDALAGVGHIIGFAQIAFADNEFGWVAIEGTNIKVRAAKSAAADAQLWSFTVSGVVEDASSAGAIELHGVTLVTTVASVTAAVEIIARAPYASWTDL